MSTLNTRVTGDPSAVRATAAGLGAIGAGMTGAGSGFATASSASEVLWSGAAGGAFRFGLLSVRRATDEVARATRQARRAMDAFADDLATVRTMVARARTVGSAAGLEVGADGIAPPKRPAAPPVGVLAPAVATAVADRWTADAARYRRQMDAYEQAREILTQARTLEQAARERLGTELASVRELIGGISASGALVGAGAWGSAMSSTLANADEWADRWAGEERRLQQTYERLRTIADSPDVAISAPELKATATRQAVDARLDMIRQGRRAATPEKLGRLGSAGATRWPSVRSVLSEAGPSIAVAGTYYDVATTEGTLNKIHVGGADVAGYLAGVGTESALVGAGVAGAPETLGASLLAVGVGYGVSETIKDPGRTWDIAKNGLGQVIKPFIHPSFPHL